MRRMTDREDAHRSQTKAATDMYQTKNDLPAQTRADVIGIRNARLADSIDLMHQAKQAHWHVKRPSFIALHKLFDDVVDAAEDSMDLLAERVVQVGGTAEGTIQVATARTGLKAYPLTLAEERAHVEVLASALAAYGTSICQGIEQDDALGDRDTAHFHQDLTGCRHVSLVRGGPPRVVRPSGDQRMPVITSQEQPTTTGKARS
jgi:starvation-inducible DNA-binding protein